MNVDSSILIAGFSYSGRPSGMGAKYLPTIKDQKAAQRFQQKQNSMPPLKKTPRDLPGKKTKKK